MSRDISLEKVDVEKIEAVLNLSIVYVFTHTRHLTPRGKLQEALSDMYLYSQTICIGKYQSFGLSKSFNISNS